MPPPTANDETLTAVLLSLSQLTITLQAHLTASNSTQNTPTPNNHPAENPSHGDESHGDRLPAVPVANNNTPPPRYTSAVQEEPRTELDPLSPAAIVLGLTGMYSHDWYVVTVGRTPGIYTTWLATFPEVHRVSGKCYKKFKSKQVAIDAYTDAWDRGEVRRVQ